MLNAAHLLGSLRDFGRVLFSPVVARFRHDLLKVHFRKRQSSEFEAGVNIVGNRYVCCSGFFCHNKVLISGNCEHFNDVMSQKQW